MACVTWLDFLCSGAPFAFGSVLLLVAFIVGLTIDKRQADTGLHANAVGTATEPLLSPGRLPLSRTSLVLSLNSNLFMQREFPDIAGLTEHYDNEAVKKEMCSMEALQVQTIVSQDCAIVLHLINSQHCRSGLWFLLLRLWEYCNLQKQFTSKKLTVRETVGGVSCCILWAQLQSTSHIMAKAYWKGCIAHSLLGKFDVLLASSNYTFLKRSKCEHHSLRQWIEQILMRRHSSMPMQKRIRAPSLIISWCLTVMLQQCWWTWPQTMRRRFALTSPTSCTSQSMLMRMPMTILTGPSQEALLAKCNQSQNQA